MNRSAVSFRSFDGQEGLIPLLRTRASVKFHVQCFGDFFVPILTKTAKDLG
jgi:hypothetical protein